MQALVLVALLFFVSFSLRAEIPGFGLESACSLASIRPAPLLANPAKIKPEGKFQACFGYSPSIFGLKELSPASVGAAYGLGESLGIAARMSSYGSDIFRETAAEVKVSQTIENLLSLGIAVKYSNFYARDYSSLNKLEAAIGGVLHIEDNLDAGFFLTNIFGETYAQTDETAVRTAVFGAGYSPADNLRFDADVRIALEGKSGFSLASAYTFADFVQARLAYQTYPQIVEFGAKATFLKNWNALVILDYHNDLGFGREFVLCFSI